MNYDQTVCSSEDAFDANTTKPRGGLSNINLDVFHYPTSIENLGGFFVHEIGMTLS